ncbi:M48 family metallopeptidase [Candidatus Pelagibacter sp.]|nr:M48 family metallopeptidase [Candidatus Pelagibacter sp.]
MNNLDKFRYSFDDPSQLNISLKKDPYEKATIQKSDNINQLLSTSVRVTKEIFPNINSAIENVFKRLKIENNLNFFVTANHFQTQASCSAMPLGDSAEIILTSKLIELLNGEELESVIAHEVAHFYYQHALYPQPNSTMNRVETLNLLNFSRAAEISADRIGFIGCGSLESSLRAMLKITSGLSDKHLKFNFSNYLDQLRELKEIKGDKNLMYSTHPNFLNRMQALIWFSMSNEYNQDLNSNKKGSFDLKTVDQKIDESIKKVIGDEVDYSNKDVVSRALMWGSIEIFLSDKKFSKKEQELFKKNFGEKRAQSMLSFMKMANPKSIQAKIDNTFQEASKLLKKDKENIVNELSKLIKVADGDQNILKNTIKKLKTSIKLYG